MKVSHTQTLDEITMAVSFAEAAGDISLIYGDAGLGKTVSLKEYVRLHPDTIYVELKTVTGPQRGYVRKYFPASGGSRGALTGSWLIPSPSIWSAVQGL